MYEQYTEVSLLPDIEDVKKLKKELVITNYELSKRSGIALATVDDIFKEKRFTKSPRYLTMKAIIETLKKIAGERIKLRSGTHAGEFCITNLKKIKSSETIYQAQKKFWKYPGITTFPVFNGDKLIGLVNSETIRHAKEKNIKNWKKLNVRKAMTAPPLVVEYLTEINTLKTMIHGPHDCVLVSKKNNRKAILGIITSWDLLMLNPSPKTNKSEINNSNRSSH
jgi:predicted transcriptional regulator